MDESTTLADLLELNLHDCEEEVKNIVDKAVKEMSMERYMKELNAIWSKMEFEKEIHARTGATLIRASEELIETLEENQVKTFQSKRQTQSISILFFHHLLHTGPVAKSHHLQVHSPFSGRGVQLAAEVEHRGPSDHDLVRGATNLDASGKYLHLVRGYTQTIAHGCREVRQDRQGVQANDGGTREDVERS